MIQLGTPAIEFGLDGMDWLIIIGASVLIIGTRVFLRWRENKKRKQQEAEIEEVQTEEHES
ncbi:MAG: hypothetical protein JJ975_15775 [Bacteroidia bacterium]|nr:hypothetical protein [Bacteroidia bacterium]